MDALNSLTTDDRTRSGGCLVPVGEQTGAARARLAPSGGMGTVSRASASAFGRFAICEARHAVELDDVSCTAAVPRNCVLQLYKCMYGYMIAYGAATVVHCLLCLWHGMLL
jgi:hypothetical protein